MLSFYLICFPAESAGGTNCVKSVSQGHFVYPLIYYVVLLTSSLFVSVFDVRDKLYYAPCVCEVYVC